VITRGAGRPSTPYFNAYGADPGTEDGNRLNVLLVPVDDYENKNHAIEPPEPTQLG
jgi:antitoxin component HigA of HigAB toxin-antitoxin module